MLFLAEATTTNWEVCKSKMQPPSSLGCICLTLQASRGYDSIYGHQEPPPLLAKMCNCGITRFLTSSLTGGERKVKYLPYLVAYSKIFSIGNLKCQLTYGKQFPNLLPMKEVANFYPGNIKERHRVVPPYILFGFGSVTPELVSGNRLLCLSESQNHY